MHDPDQDLVLKAQAGDKNAYAKLVERHYEMILAVSYGVLNQRQEAQDATQEVFIKVFDQIKNFEGKSKFKSWLYRIATNHAIDATRRRKPNETIDKAETLATQHISPDEEVVQNETKKMIREALNLLSPEHRAILVLREWHNLSYEEIAEALNLEIGTVMSRLFYARKSLGKILEPKIRKMRQ